MITLYLPDERIPFQVGDLTFELTQLTEGQKLNLISLLSEAEKSPEAGMKAAKQALKYSVKGVSGIKLSDGSEFQVELENGVLTDRSASALMNLRGIGKIQALCLGFLTGFEGECVDAAGNPIPGVSLVKRDVQPSKN